jgi:hypothetical protein
MAEKKIKVKTIPLKAYTKKDIRIFYGLSERTFKEWIKPFRKELGIGNGHFLTVTQVKYIFEKFGVPGDIEVD